VYIPECDHLVVECFVVDRDAQADSEFVQPRVALAEGHSAALDLGGPALLLAHVLQLLHVFGELVIVLKREDADLDGAHQHREVELGPQRLPLDLGLVGAHVERVLQDGLQDAAHAEAGLDHVRQKLLFVDLDFLDFEAEVLLVQGLRFAVDFDSEVLVFLE